MSYDFLVVGCGSIGRRHAKNLLSLGQEVCVMDIAVENRRWAEENLSVRTYSELSEALASKPDAVLVCTPPSTHLEISLRALSAGCHLFIEKPIADRMEGVERVERLAREKNLYVQVGYCFRFVPALVALKKAICSGKYGKPLYLRSRFSQYLPYWRPGTDYRQGYTGKRRFGGHLILEETHQLDYACWFLGKPKSLFAVCAKLSNLQVDTEDTAEILLRFSSGAIASIHMDFVYRGYARSCEVVCEKAVLCWELEKDAGRSVLKASLISRDGKVKPTTLLDVPWKVNDMYVEEMKAFIGGIRARKRPASNVEDARLALRLALSALASAKRNSCTVHL